MVETHVAGNNILPGIIINVGDINAHAEHGTLGKPVAGMIGKGAVAIVNVEVIVHGKIVAAIYIHPSIVVHIGCTHCQTHLIESNTQPQKYHLISLLNAYNQEIYHADYYYNNQIMQLTEPTSYTAASVFFEKLANKNYDLPLIFTGNGSTLHQKLISHFFKEKEYQIIEIPHANAESIGIIGKNIFIKNKNISYEVQPLYLKKETFVTLK